MEHISSANSFGVVGLFCSSDFNSSSGFVSASRLVIIVPLFLLVMVLICFPVSQMVCMILLCFWKVHLFCWVLWSFMVHVPFRVHRLRWWWALIQVPQVFRDLVNGFLSLILIDVF